MRKNFRVAILCEGTVFKHWQAECIRKVLAVEGVVPVLLIEHDKPPPVERKPSMRHAAYRWFKKRLVRARSLEPDDLTVELAGVPRISCRPAGSAMEQNLDPKDIATIRGHSPDVLLRFGFGVLQGDILTTAPHGVWGYHHGDEDRYRGRPAGFWEIMHKDPVTGVSLQRLTEKVDAGNILLKGWFPTVDRSLSENLDSVMLATTGWMAQLCREILMGRTEASIGVPSASEAPLLQAPGNLEVLNFLLTCNSNRIAHDRRKSRRDEWNIGVLYQPITSLLEAKPSLNVRWLPPPSPGQHRRSPFGYVAEGQLNVLYGKYDSVTGNGDISRLRPKRDNVLKRSRTMLTGEHTLSHPFVLEHEGRLFVIPESDRRGVELYRVNGTNEALEFVASLVDEPLCAPTVFQHEGRWWLMGTKPPWTDVALHAYHAPSLEGPWIPHVLNPVKMDVRCSRPAGTPFVHQGQMYRPALDNSHSSGCRVALMRVLELDPVSFREELVRTIGPLKGSAWSHGTSTLSAVGDLTLVDGMRPVSSRPRAAESKRRGSRSGRHEPTKPLDDDDDDED